MSNFHISILTSFPEMLPGTLAYSLAGKALESGIWSYDIINIRDFGKTKHRNIDDEPLGGGNGLVMRPDVLGDALDHTLSKYPNSIIYYMSPRGKVLKQEDLPKILGHKNIIILCGRFEGIDERVIEEYDIREISIGDFILSGGEIAAIAMIDACLRLIPGVLKNSETLKEESFNIGNESKLLEYPLYTRPAKWKGRKAPEILLSGHHAKISEWRLEKSKEITQKRRPDLL